MRSLSGSSDDVVVGEDGILVFPCDLAIKVFGRNVSSFRDAVVEIFRSHRFEPPAAEIREQLSRNSGYTSLTITIQAQSREQVDALYEELSASDDIMMVL